MDPINETPVCPVCGFPLDRPAWDALSGPSEEICPSCGIQFGYSDAAGGDPVRRQEIYKSWRRKWVEGGMKWHFAGIEEPPAGWDPVGNCQTMRSLRLSSTPTG